MQSTGVSREKQFIDEILNIMPRLWSVHRVHLPGLYSDFIFNRFIEVVGICASVQM